MSYTELLKTNKWKAKCYDVLLRDHFVCQDCGCRGVHNNTFFPISKIKDLNYLIPVELLDGKYLNDFCVGVASDLKEAKREPVYLVSNGLRENLYVNTMMTISPFEQPLHFITTIPLKSLFYKQYHRKTSEIQYRGYVISRYVYAVIAGVAKEKGILTVGVITIPFAFEGKVRIEKALKGVEEMRKNVDSLLVINNERLCELYADGITTVEQAFAKADEIVTVAAKSISEIITMEGIVNRDFCDVQTVMENGGKAIMTVGRANGESRIGKAFVDALKSPLLNNVEIEKARRLLYIIYSSDEHQVTISELEEINLFMDDLAQDIEVLWGVYRDNSLDEDVRVALIATDFSEDLPEKQNEKAVDDKNLMNSFQMYYGKTKNEEKENINENIGTKEETVAKNEEKKICTPKSSNNTFLERFMKKLENILDMTE